VSFCDAHVDCKALKCYDCNSFDAEDCGPLFKASSEINIIDCEPDVTLCVLQRQPAIPRG